MKRRPTMLGLMLLGVLMLVPVSIAGAVELRNLPEKVRFSLGGGEGGGGFKVATLSGKAVECKALAGTGEFTSERLGTAEFKFKECKGPLNVTCTGLSDVEGSITVKAEFHTRHLLPASEGVNVAMLPSVAHFSCFGILFTASGCVASMDLLTKSAGVSIVNLLISSVFIQLLQAGGDPNPLSIDTDNSLGMENCELSLKEGSGAAEMAATSDAGNINEFEAGGTKVTELVDLSGTS